MDPLSSDDPAEELRGLQNRLRLLSETTPLFAEATGDYARLLEVIVERTAEHLGSFCAVWMLTDDEQWIEPVAAYDRDPAALTSLLEVFVPRAVRTDRELRTVQVIRTGKSALVTEITDDETRARFLPEQLETALGLKMRSMLMVAMRAHGKTLGALTMMRHGEGARSLDARDLELAETLAAHAAIALTNARLLASEREARVKAERAQAAQRESEAAQRLMFDASPVAVVIFDADTLRFVAANDAAIALYGYARDELLTRRLSDLRGDGDPPLGDEAVREAMRSGWRGAGVHRRKDGTTLHVEIVGRPLSLAGRAVWMGAVQDVTSRLALEAQLRQSQKMEAVGRLTGGIAHDFNNMLSVILSYSTLLAEDLPTTGPAREELREIHAAATRAAELTSQLLLFSRQQVTDAKVLDVNGLLDGLEKMLRRLLGADIEFAIVRGVSLGKVRADYGHLEQMVMNLVVNARDAMPRGGRLTIETSNFTLDDAYARDHFGAHAGPHVMIAVSDTGVGMSKATQARIFEPFFTTKGVGEGTGLGLSTVFGIAQQSGGSVWVYSEPGHGTTFKVFLPIVDEEVSARPDPTPYPNVQGTETVLLVEHEDAVRAIVRSLLLRAGFTVIEAQDGVEAIHRSGRHPEVIDLLVTDVVMPGMSGPDLARRLVAQRPEMKVLCMSGYTDDIALRHGVVSGDAYFLQKPITPESLLRKVREVLDEPAPKRW